MANDLQELRRSALVLACGPGSIVDFRADGGLVSGVTAGLEVWDQSFGPAGMTNHQVIRETRLQKKLGVKGFRTPPVVDDRPRGGKPDNRRLVAVRFPNWLLCPRCDSLKPAGKWAWDSGKAYLYCPTCTGESEGEGKVFVIPARIVMACKRGHIDEFPWDWWVGHKPGCSRNEYADRPENHPGLHLRSERPGHAGLVLSCPVCKASRSLDGVFSRQTWERWNTCSGRRPWLIDGKEKCDQKPRAVQRGASNLYFPITESALSIPPWSDRLQEILGSWWSTLVNFTDMSRLEGFISDLAMGDLETTLRHLKMTPKELADAIRGRLSQYGKVKIDDLKPEEYKQFVAEPVSSKIMDSDFEIRHERVPQGISPWVSRVVRAPRLREVRAITGFTRINPPGDYDSPMKAELSKTKLDWYPAIEVRGEGIFLDLTGKPLLKWQQQPEVVKRARECDSENKRQWQENHDQAAGPPRDVTPRYMLCHTFAHVLMRQLTLECGYSSASLRERIYIGTEDDPIAAILIYTATADSDGTLGGLERLGKEGSIEGILRRAIKAVEWCSSDPLCITDMMGAAEGCSHSVCHACCLVPETSCEAFNKFLDRAFLIGTVENPDVGYFREMIY